MGENVSMTDGNDSKALAAEALAAAVDRAQPELARVKASILKQVKRGSRVMAAKANLLTTKPIPGFTQRWVLKNDTEIGQRLERGYRPVNRESGLPIDTPAVPAASLDGVQSRHDLVLMAAPTELVEEQQRAIQARVDERERGLKRAVQIEANRKNSDGVGPIPLEGTVRIERDVRVIR